MYYYLIIRNLLMMCIFFNFSFTCYGSEPASIIHYPTRVTSIKFTSDEKKIIVAGFDGYIRIVDVANRMILQDIKISNEKIDVLDITNNDKSIAMLKNGNVKILNLSSGNIINTTKAQNAKFMRDPSKIALNYGRAGVGLWDIDKRSEYMYIDVSSIGTPMDISPNGSNIAFGYPGNLIDSRYGYVIIWDLENNNLLYELNEEETYAIESVQFSENGRWILTGHGPSVTYAEANLWDLETGIRIKRYVLEEVARLEFNAFFLPGEEKIITVLPSRPLVIFDLNTSDVITEIEIGETFNSFTLSPFGNYYAVWSDGEIKIRKMDISTNIVHWYHK